MEKKLYQKPLEANSDLAVVGAGIAGLSAAWLLSRRYKVTLYERETRPGGHSNTITVPDSSKPIPIDTGFIVYNERNYPNLTALFRHLNVATQPTEMSFGVSADEGKLEYSGSGLLGLFAQPQNLFQPRLWRLLRDLVRFYHESTNISASSHRDSTIGDFLDEHAYSETFINHHLVPLLAAIWSAPATCTLQMPLYTVIQFFSNHGLLQIRNRPNWRSVCNGSRNYVWRLMNAIQGTVRLSQPIDCIVRSPDGVMLRDSSGRMHEHDGVVVATHADEALSLLAMPTNEEKSILGAFSYQMNRAVVHSDSSLMPRHKSVWSAWNVLSTNNQEAPVSVTYWMNKLQNLNSSKNFFVSLNPISEPRIGATERILKYDHPIFDVSAVSAQTKLQMLQGIGNIWFCGSYFGYGFHEDALRSGLEIAELLGVKRPWNPEYKTRKSNRISKTETLVLEISNG